MQKVPHSGMQEIYEIACDTWKKKIEKMTSVFGDTELSDAQVEEMFSASNDKQKKVLKKYLKESSSEITCWKDVVKAVGAVTYPFNNPKTPEEKSINALVEGFAIAKAFNKGTVLTWEDTDTDKYIPRKYFSDGRWVVDGGVWCFIAACFPVGLAFKNSKDAVRAYELFPEVYDALFMFK